VNHLNLCAEDTDSLRQLSQLHQPCTVDLCELFEIDHMQILSSVADCCRIEVYNEKT
jgi:hypothetical protein